MVIGSSVVWLNGALLIFFIYHVGLFFLFFFFTVAEIYIPLQNKQVVAEWTFTLLKITLKPLNT